MAEYQQRKRKQRGKLYRAAVLGLAFLVAWMFCMGGAVTKGAAVYAAEIPEALSNLHARSAVLMDADSGRVLFEKNGYERRAMASTTKIMTCILALEEMTPDQIVTVSKKAAAQPRVHLGMTEGERFYLKDLLYSLMLESHNDSACAIAEAIGGSVEGFAQKMNEKALEIGCSNTYFITPNGLDASDERGVHSTTAAELCQMMRYCLTQSGQTKQFLEITRTASKTFTDVEGKHSYSCNNHNAFLNMMEGALTGKTGFTADAGYCYVGALRQGERTFIVALLGCGWPSHKGYKWEDTRALMHYGLSHFRSRECYKEYTFRPVSVTDGHKKGQGLFEETKLSLSVDTKGEKKSLTLLLSDEERVEISCRVDEVLEAPVKKGDRVGSVTYTLHGVTLREDKVSAAETILKNTFGWTLSRLAGRFFLQGW